jgi:hypothetical protein
MGNLNMVRSVSATNVLGDDNEITMRFRGWFLLIYEPGYVIIILDRRLFYRIDVKKGNEHDDEGT